MREVLPDGRVKYTYFDGATTYYTPVKSSERKYKRHTPPWPGAIRWDKQWFPALDFLPDEDRTMPQTYPFRDVMKRRNGVLLRDED